MKIIFSRKGFDSRSGGCFSPYHPSTGLYIWMPIPEKVPFYQHAHSYSSLPVTEGYLPGVPGRTLSEVYCALHNNRPVRVNTDQFADIRTLDAHWDPMLGVPPWYPKDFPEDFPEIGRGFGQATAAGHLYRQRVGAGDVFLFFAGFRSIHRSPARKGHYVFGWMKVGKRIDTFAEATKYMRTYGLTAHPHCTREAFTRRNLLFLPADWLYEDLEIPGCGYFRTLNESLQLSHAHQTPATWRLPGFFMNKVSQVYQRSWRMLPTGECTVQTGQGQEFVASVEHSVGNQWLRALFEKNKDNLHAPKGNLDPR